MPGSKLIETYITPRDAAKLLGCGQQSIEAGLRNRTFPIGMAWYSGGNKKGQWNYRIPRNVLIKAIETGVISSLEPKGDDAEWIYSP